MRFLYTLLLIMMFPYLLLRLWWKGRQLHGYRERIHERFGLGLKGSQSVDIWIHAVSLGEVIAATPLIHAWLAASKRVLVTTMTPTGSAQVERCFGQSVLHQYIPYDFFYAFKRFLRHYQPQVGVMMETELWPNLIVSAYKARLPLVLVNGRLSETSFLKYRLLKRWFSTLLNYFAILGVQTQADAQRFIQLGVDQTKIDVLGNIKFDLVLPTLQHHPLQQLKVKWGERRIVLLLASMHEGEELLFLKLLPQLKKAIPECLLLIAPRHPERFKSVYKLCEGAGYTVAYRHDVEKIHEGLDVVVLDTLGELLYAYACSDYAFVGGSLVPVGGHNVLEAIAVGVPVFVGPYTHHFQWITAALHEAQAIQQVNTAQNCIEKLIFLHHHPQARLKQIQIASRFLKAHQGSVHLYLDKIAFILCRDHPSYET